MSAIKFRNTDPFLHELKRLAKKHRSLVTDVVKLRDSLSANPFQGADLGGGLRKVRMAITSKGKGKSGGARVITHLEAITAEHEGTITFLYIYDKSERITFSDNELAMLVSMMKSAN
ncbi:MAG: type II toxin-antitoxin system RelE/ParE family toxin [Bacteroidaceae bacterium]|nr:type II toxin-antitoxin system RelE/ParE family toxin [Bacteroidaceae bacterium]